MIKGIAPTAAVVGLCGPHVRSFLSVSKAQAWASDAEHFDRTCVAAGTIGDWVFVWESNGFAGADLEYAQRMSAGSTYVSMFCNVNSLVSFTLARDSLIARRFDPVFHDDTPVRTPRPGQPCRRRPASTGRPSRSCPDSS